jgi:hypothetical protein
VRLVEMRRMSMKKAILVGLIPLTLSGCMWQSVSGKYLQIANEICDGTENIHSVDILAVGDVQVYCLDEDGRSITKDSYGLVAVTVVDDYLRSQYLKENTE